MDFVLYLFYAQIEVINKFKDLTHPVYFYLKLKIKDIMIIDNKKGEFQCSEFKSKNTEGLQIEK